MVRIYDQRKDLVQGFLGIQEPRCNLPVIEDNIRLFKLVWLVPGLAFDINGGRLGRGKGYYDFILAGTEGMKIGIGFDWQITTEIPMLAHDVEMDRILTEKRCVVCRS